MRYLSNHRARTLLSITSAAGLTLGLAACSGGSRVGDSAAQTASVANADGQGKVSGDIRLAYWGSGPRVDLTHGVAELFMEANEGTSVSEEFTDFGAHFERLNVQASSGNLPCVTQLQGRQLNDYTTRGVLLDLQPMIDSGAINVDDIPERVLDTGRGMDGTLYMIPYGAAYDALAVNETLADRSVGSLPEEGYTFEDLHEYAMGASENLPEDVPALNLGGGRPNWFIAYTQAKGEALFNENGTTGFDRQTLVDFWNYWEDLRAAGATTTPQQYSEEPEQTEQRYVAQGEAMMDTIPGNALVPASETLKGLKPNQSLTTLPLPTGEGGIGNVLFTSGFSIPRECGNVPTAAAFIDFWMNNDEGAKLFASNNGAVTNSRHLQQQLDDQGLPELKRHELETYQRIVENDPATVLYPPGYQAIFEEAFTRAYESISLGGASVEEAADSFLAEVEQELNKP